MVFGSVINGVLDVHVQHVGAGNRLACLKEFGTLRINEFAVSRQNPAEFGLGQLTVDGHFEYASSLNLNGELLRCIGEMHSTEDRGGDEKRRCQCGEPFLWHQLQHGEGDQPKRLLMYMTIRRDTRMTMIPMQQ